MRFQGVEHVVVQALLEHHRRHLRDPSPVNTPRIVSTGANGPG